MCKANFGAEGLGRSCHWYSDIASISNLIVPLVVHCSVFVEHLIEGVIKLSGDCVDLQLLPDDLVLQLVNPENWLDKHVGLHKVRGLQPEYLSHICAPGPQIRGLQKILSQCNGDRVLNALSDVRNVNMIITYGNFCLSHHRYKQDDQIETKDTSS